MNDRDVITRGIHTDCLLNYETVKYFGGEQHEGERYGNAIRDYQVLEYKVMSAYCLVLEWFMMLIFGSSLSKYAQLGSEFHHSECIIEVLYVVVYRKVYDIRLSASSLVP